MEVRVRCREYRQVLPELRREEAREHDLEMRMRRRKHRKILPELRCGTPGSMDLPRVRHREQGQVLLKLRS